VEFVFPPEDAAYFFKRQQRIRDLEPYTREEYYCRNKDPHKLIDHCLWAFSNEKFRRATGWEYYPKGEDPQCVFENVRIKKYDYNARRAFLKCPIVMKEPGQDDFYAFAYITSIDNPPLKRLIFFLFMDVTGEPTGNLGEPSRTPESPRTPRKPESIESFRDSMSSKSKRSKFYSSFKSLRESDSSPRILDIVSLLLNKRHTLKSIED
jgi:hypothetical protein